MNKYAFVKCYLCDESLSSSKVIYGIWKEYGQVMNQASYLFGTLWMESKFCDILFALLDYKTHSKWDQSLKETICSQRIIFFSFTTDPIWERRQKGSGSTLILSITLDFMLLQFTSVNFGKLISPIRKTNICQIPSWHMALTRRHLNVDAMWLHHIDITIMSFWHHMPTG